MLLLLCGELNFNLKIILNTTKGKKVFLLKNIEVLSAEMNAKEKNLVMVATITC